MNNMRIGIKREYGEVVAEPVDLPGSPPVGRGANIKEALGDFLIHYQEQLGIKIEIDATAEQAERDRRVVELNKR